VRNRRAADTEMLLAREPHQCLSIFISLTR
jgi:hypothetical protein